MAAMRQLRYFVAVAHRLHFTKAADDLSIAQPALSQSIRALERELDVLLFDRKTRGVALTPAGQVLLSGAEHALAAVDQALADARSYAGLVTGAFASAPGSRWRCGSPCCSPRFAPRIQQ